MHLCIFVVTKLFEQRICFLIISTFNQIECFVIFAQVCGKQEHQHYSNCNNRCSRANDDREFRLRLLGNFFGYLHFFGYGFFIHNNFLVVIVLYFEILVVLFFHFFLSPFCLCFFGKIKKCANRSQRTEKRKLQLSPNNQEKTSIPCTRT